MACVLSAGITAVCQYDTSGVEKLWLGNKSSLTGTTYVEYNDCGEVTGLTFSSGTTVIYEVQAALDSITFTDDLVVNGSRRNFLHTINFNIGKLDCTNMGIMEDIGLSNMFAITKNADGTYRIFGLNGSGLRSTVMSDASGTNTGNDGLIAVTLSGSSTAKARFIESAFAATLGLS